jgi:hypothetical protein
MKVSLTIYLSMEGEKLLRETNWLLEAPELPADSDTVRDDLIKTGILYFWEDGSVHLTDVGEDILIQLK